MTPREKMIHAWYKAFEVGVSKIIKNGLAFTIMLGVIGGLIWGLFYVIETHREDRQEWKAEFAAVKAEYADEINRLRVQVYECTERNAQLTAQLARLEERLNYK